MDSQPLDGAVWCACAFVAAPENASCGPGQASMWTRGPNSMLARGPGDEQDRAKPSWAKLVVKTASSERIHNRTLRSGSARLVQPYCIAQRGNERRMRLAFSPRCVRIHANQQSPPSFIYFTSNPLRPPFIIPSFIQNFFFLSLFSSCNIVAGG